MDQSSDCLRDSIGYLIKLYIDWLVTGSPELLPHPEKSPRVLQTRGHQPAAADAQPGHPRVGQLGRLRRQSGVAGQAAGQWKQ